MTLFCDLLWSLCSSASCLGLKIGPSSGKTKFCQSKMKGKIPEKDILGVMVFCVAVRGCSAGAQTGLSLHDGK